VILSSVRHDKEGGPASARASARSEAGFTLIEVVVAVLILGVGVVAILGGLATAVFGSGLHRNQADLDAALVTAEEKIKAAPYQSCSGSNPTGVPYTASTGYTEVAIGTGNYATYANPSPAPSPGQGYFTISVQYWNGSSSSFNGYPPDSWVTVSTASGCLPAVPPTDTELVSITGFSPNHQANQTIGVVKGSAG
jgi:prepilin-type N-terminal cleavage/methylation domain-containing protein